MINYWKTLLNLVKAIAQEPEEIEFCCFVPDKEHSILINSTPAHKQASEYILVTLSEKAPSGQFGASFEINTISKLKILSNTFLSEDKLAFLSVYLPYCVLSLRADAEKRAIAIGHFAQTLDGKIATRNGDSRWIGNEENLIHAHRMRALCEGILIGRGTLQNDLPQLTVRKVEGVNPKRVVLASPSNDFNCLFKCSPDPIIVIGKEPSDHNGSINYHQLSSENGHIKCRNILAHLYELGIKTVYIEGGSVTTSNFIKEGVLDILQLHISPLLFGSGKSGIDLPEIMEVRDGIQFQNFSFHNIGDTVMFMGEPHK